MRQPLLLGIFAAALLARAAQADLAPGPRRPAQPAQPTRLVVEVDDKAKDVRLIIPIEALNGGNPFGGPGIGFPGGGFQGIPGGGAPPPFPGTQPPKSTPPKQSALPLSTIMVASALAIAFAFSGLWFVRRKPGNGFKAMLLAVVLLGAGTTAVVMANRAPPRPPMPPPVEEKSNLPMLASMDNVRVEIVGRRGPVRLIVPASMKDKFSAEKK